MDWKKKAREIKEDLKSKTAAILAFGIAGVGIWALVQLLYIFYGFDTLLWLKGIPYLSTVIVHLVNEVQSQSILGILYLYIISSLFFLPIPLEAIYFTYLGQLPPEVAFGTAVVGILIGQVINYGLGRLFGRIFQQFIKKKTRRSMHHKLTKYGIAAILFVHIVPFPFQIFNVISGIFRYKFFKWLFFVTLGLSIKHAIMYGIFVLL